MFYYYILVNAVVLLATAGYGIAGHWMLNPEILRFEAVGMAKSKLPLTPAAPKRSAA